MTIDTKNDFLKVKNFLITMKKNKILHDYSINDVIYYLKKLNKNKFKNKNKKNYKPKTELNWNIFK